MQKLYHQQILEIVAEERLDIKASFYGHTERFNNIFRDREANTKVLKTVPLFYIDWSEERAMLYLV